MKPGLPWFALIFSEWEMLGSIFLLSGAERPIRQSTAWILTEQRIVQVYMRLGSTRAIRVEMNDQIGDSAPTWQKAAPTQQEATRQHPWIPFFLYIFLDLSPATKKQPTQFPFRLYINLYRPATTWLFTLFYSSHILSVNLFWFD